MKKYFPHDYLSKRLYDLIFKDHKELPNSTSIDYWCKITIHNKPEWSIIRLLEVHKYSNEVSQQRIKAMLGINQ